MLRQLVSYVGRDAFFAGLHEYLTKHSYANATLDDLLTELAAASGRDLASWSKVWLEEAGVDMLHVAQANHTGNMADTIPLWVYSPTAFLRTLPDR